MKRKELSHVKIFVDGGCLSNGAADASAYGSYSVFAVKRTGEEVVVRHSGHLQFPGCNTNNQAEYMALIRAAEYVLGLKSKGFQFPTTFFTDSRLVKCQLVDGWKVKDQTLRQLNKTAVELLDQIEDVQIVKVDRSSIVEVLGH